MYKPESPNKYKGNQIILNSGRLVFNAKDDALMWFAKKAIVLSSAGSVNIDSNEHFIVGSPKIYLGLEAHKEKEPILLGNKTNETLKSLIDSLKSFLDLIKTGGASPQAIMAATGLLQGKIIVLEKRLKSRELLSKQNFTV